jgi:hypothetical protein
MSEHGKITGIRPLMLVVFVIVVGLAANVAAQPPEVPSDFFIRAEATDKQFEIKVTWKDFSTEDMYQLLASTDSTPGPIFEGQAGNISLGPSWELRATLEANKTEFIDPTIFSQLYVICAYRGHEVTCAGPSAFVSPKYPPNPASVDSIQVSQRTTNSLRLQWTQSSDTTFSRASIKRSGSNNTIDSAENDADQSVTFTGLDSNVSFELTVCVRNAEQDDDEPTCRSTTSSTLPQAPLTPLSVSVDQDDPNPTRRTISFRYNNAQSNAVGGIAIRIIKDNQVVTQHDVRPEVFDTRDHQHTFTGLEPFTGYEAWVIPYNQTGVGTSIGIGFTTPTQINLAIQPLSGDSAMIRLVRADIGEYTIQGKNGPLWVHLGTIRQTQKGEPRAVLGNLSGSREIRVLWRLAYLRSETTGTAAPRAAGAPEILSIDTIPILVPDAPSRLRVNRPSIGRLGTRFTVKFRTTDAGVARYILQRRTTSGWANVNQTLSQRFGDDSTLSLTHDAVALMTGYRVCRSQRIGRSNLVCSESSEWATENVRRLGLTRLPRVIPTFRFPR